MRILRRGGRDQFTLGHVELVQMPSRVLNIYQHDDQERELSYREPAE